MCKNSPAVFKYATLWCPQFPIPVFRLGGGKKGYLKSFMCNSDPSDVLPPCKLVLGCTTLEDIVKGQQPTEHEVWMAGPLGSIDLVTASACPPESLPLRHSQWPRKGLVGNHMGLSSNHPANQVANQTWKREHSLAVVVPPICIKLV